MMNQNESLLPYAFVSYSVVPKQLTGKPSPALPSHLLFIREPWKFHLQDIIPQSQSNHPFLFLHPGNTMALTWIAESGFFSDLPGFTCVNLGHIMPSSALLKSSTGSFTSCNIKAKVLQRYMVLHNQCFFSYSSCSNCFLFNHAHTCQQTGLLMAGSLSAILFHYLRALTPSRLQAHVTFARIPMLTIILNTTTGLPWLLPTLESVMII